MSRTLPEDEERARYLYWEMGFSDAAIAWFVGVTKATLNQWRRRRGLSENGDSGQRISKRHYLWYEMCSTRGEMAAFLDVNPQSVYQWIRRNGLPQLPSAHGVGGGPPVHVKDSPCLWCQEDVGDVVVLVRDENSCADRSKWYRFHPWCFNDFQQTHDAPR